MKNPAALQKFIDLLRPGAVVPFVGAAGRTWYTDIADLEHYVLGALDAGCAVRSGARPPFDSYVELIACAEGYDVEIYGPAPLDLKARLAWSRPIELLDDAACLVAFPREGEDVLSADPLVEAALYAGLGVLAVYRKRIEWYTEDTYVFV